MKQKKMKKKCGNNNWMGSRISLNRNQGLVNNREIGNESKRTFRFGNDSG